MHVLELKVPPPAVAIVLAALMWICAWATPAIGFLFPARNLCVIGLAVAGLAIDIVAIVSFVRAGTTVNPMKPESSSSLVVSGIYKLTRNPMYLGSLLFLAAWAIYLSNVPAFLLLPAFILYINRFQIAPEERALTARFGQEFDAYKASTRRWL